MNNRSSAKDHYPGIRTAEEPQYDVVQDVRLSPIVEFAIVGGLGVLIITGPAIASFVKRKVQVLTARLVVIKDRLYQAELAKKLEILNRRRKVGSIVRVIGSLLPNSAFTPPCRIYIPNWAQLCNNQLWLNQPQNLIGMELITNIEPPSENLVGDGLIEAFEVASEVISSLSGDEDDDETASSSPEGWAQEQREFPKNFNPNLNVTDPSFARCSTPKGHRQTLHFSVTQASQHDSRIYEETTEMSELKKMVEGLMHQINHLNQSLITTRSQLNMQQTIVSAETLKPESHQVPPPAFNYAAAQLQPQPVVATIDSSEGIHSASVPPPPPPPPPMALEGSRPLVIARKGNQTQLLEKKPQASLSDVLKELPNAKLRRVERSPGGTPIKPQLKLAPDSNSLDIRSQLESALKKRFESMHSPMGEPEDKENVEDSEDSFEDNPVSAKRTLFPIIRSPAPRRRSSGNPVADKGTPPFGQHLLKRRNVQESDGEPLPLPVAVLRQQN